MTYLNRKDNMRQVTQTYTVYNYEDIMKPENATLREAIITKRREEIEELGLFDRCYQEPMLEQFQQELADKGFLNATIYYNGFGSQGDGACFDCDLFNLDLLLDQSNNIPEDRQALIKLVEDKLTIEISNIGPSMYVHEMTRRFCIVVDDIHDRELSNLIIVFANEIESLRRHYCNEMYTKLQDAYYELHSEKSILDWVQENNLEFYENGKLFVNDREVYPLQ